MTTLWFYRDNALIAVARVRLVDAFVREHLLGASFTKVVEADGLVNFLFAVKPSLADF